MNGSEFRLYQTDDGQTQLQVRFGEETVWLSQRQMAELFDKDVRTINEHIKNVYEEAELGPEATIRNFRIVQQEGTRQIERDVAHYNLEVIISVGYRVKFYNVGVIISIGKLATSAAPTRRTVHAWRRA